ncbi:response regulator [Sphingomonas lutea]|nr:response regulator [Sphingomonas lutea]
MIVEDEALVALLIEDILLANGHEVVGIADDALSALAAVDGDQPNLALVDVCLAGNANGVDVAKAFADRGIPSLFVTGNCPAEDMPIAIGCLHKPFTEESLSAAVACAERLLEGHAARSLPANMHLYSSFAANGR